MFLEMSNSIEITFDQLRSHRRRQFQDSWVFEILKIIKIIEIKNVFFFLMMLSLSSLLQSRSHSKYPPPQLCGLTLSQTWAEYQVAGWPSGMLTCFVELWFSLRLPWLCLTSWCHLKSIFSAFSFILTYVVFKMFAMNVSDFTVTGAVDLPRSDTAWWKMVS